MRALTEEQREAMEADIADVARETCETIMRKLGAIPDGVLLGLCHKGAILQRVPMPADFRIRTAMAEGCRKLLLAEKAVAYAFAMEAWTRPASAEDLKKPAGSIADMPDREEAVLIVGQTPAGGFGFNYSIVRSSTGAFVELRKNDPGFHGFSGIWTDLLYRQQAS